MSTICNFSASGSYIILQHHSNLLQSFTADGDGAAQAGVSFSYLINSSLAATSFLTYLLNQE